MRWVALVGLCGCQLVYPAREPDVVCSTPAMFTDSFDGDTLDPFWTSGPDDKVPSDGRLVFVHAGDSGHFVRTKTGFQFREQAVTIAVEVDDPTRLTDPATRVSLSLLAEDFKDINAEGLAVQMRLSPDDGELRLEVGEQKDGSGSTAYFEPYDPVAHRVWRIAREGNEIVWS